MKKIFALIENGHEKDDRGVSVVSGPAGSDLKKLHKVFRNYIEGRGRHPHKSPEIHAVETSETIEFASWLIAYKKFSRPAMEVFYVDDWKEEEFRKKYEGIRNDPNTPRTKDEVNTKIEEIKKRMEKPVVQQADDPKLFCFGWSIYDEKNPEVCFMIYFPLEWAHKKGKK